MINNQSKITVALDLTEGDEFVLSYLNFLLGTLQVKPELYFFHNIKYQIDEDLLSDLNGSLTDIITDEIQEKVNQYLPNYTNNSTITVTQESSTIGALVDFVSATQCTLTVFGKKTDTEGTGLTTSRFIRQNKTSVLVVPLKSKHVLQNICTPIDFSRNAYLAYNLADKTAKQHSLQFKPMHVYHVSKVYFPYIPVKPITKGNSEKAVQLYKEFIKKYVKTATPTSCDFIDGKDSSVVQTISTYCKTQSIDFIVVGTKGESSFIGSVALGLNEVSLKIPILFVK